MTDLALSSYWMRGRWERVSDFIRAGVDFGFRSFEVSGMRCDSFYDEIHPGQFNIVSFHSPAPSRRGIAVMSGLEARRADLVLTSLDDERRRRAVTAVKRCLDVASEYGARAIVLHLGQTRADPELEQQLKQLILDGRSKSGNRGAPLAYPHRAGDRARGTHGFCAARAGRTRPVCFITRRAPWLGKSPYLPSPQF